LKRNGLHVVKADVGKEIQVLAVKDNPTKENFDDSDADSRSSFWDSASQFVLQAFGGQSGGRTLVWCKSPGATCYRSLVFRGTRLHSNLIKMASAARPAFPKMFWNHVMPGFLWNRRLRMLTVSLTGDMNLPVNVRHEGHEAVWVK